MNIQFKNSHGGLSSRLQERIERKLAKLSVFADTKEHSANATFNLERTVGSHQTGDVWEGTITIDANGSLLHASSLAETPERASEQVLKEIRVELKKEREKRRALARRGGGFWKGLQQRFSRGE
jgi:ribosome-associated translation inhibitor RaiA